ncbi:two-component response regulator 24-like [Mangifera indica]|uniref:two-component response regulator 24-like n=1 Tax=Mangifera indica TaxID=29780 RepID=UPI001CFAE09B|nr:two-component response regulator 24-like [Mangifera indica]
MCVVLGKLKKLMSHFKRAGDGRSKIRALVVDDNMVNRAIHQQLLQNLGVENQVVGNGKEAVDAHSSGHHFDLILMDMDMPVMNGIEATRRLRAMGVRSLIVGVTTRSLEQEKQAFMEAGLDDYQEKPLTTAKLVQLLDRLRK